jgi:phosphate starvation-inducible PhoH-like protein
LADIQLKAQVQARSPNQSAYLESMQRNTFTFSVGLAGTGKTFLATWQAVLELLNNDSKIRRIVVVRPVIHNRFGESIGALPGNITEKMLPYGSSVLDNMNAFLDHETITRMIYDGTIEFIPLTLLRGRSLNNAFVIVEEAQNIKKSGKGVYMVMSRLGIHSKMVFNGDLGQSDLESNESALKAAIEVLSTPDMVKGVGVVELYDKRDVQRNALLYEIMERFGELDNNPF